MPRWGDESHDWAGLYAAEISIISEFRKYRIGAHVKEKWGYLRFSNMYPPYNIHNLLYPGYVYNQYKHDWMWKLDCKYGNALITYTGIQFLVYKIQQYLIIKTLKRACTKWPHLVKYILADFDDDFKKKVLW